MFSWIYIIFILFNPKRSRSKCHFSVWLHRGLSVCSVVYLHSSFIRLCFLKIWVLSSVSHLCTICWLFDIISITAFISDTDSSVLFSKWLLFESYLFIFYHIHCHIIYFNLISLFFSDGLFYSFIYLDLYDIFQNLIVFYFPRSPWWNW